MPGRHSMQPLPILLFTAAIVTAAAAYDLMMSQAVRHHSAVKLWSGSRPHGWCDCLTLRDITIHRTVCGPPIGALTPKTWFYGLGNRERAADISACGRRWSPLFVYGSGLLWSPEGSRQDKSCFCPGKTRQPAVKKAGGRRSSGPSVLLVRCLCQVESKCRRDIGCVQDQGSLSCGPYQIKEAYWIDASQQAKRKLGGDWKSCTTGADNMNCSSTTIKYYMDRYAQRCVGDRIPTDEDFARIHNGGPNGCKLPITLPYWKKVAACMATAGEYHEIPDAL